MTPADPYLVDCAQTFLRCRDLAAEHGTQDARVELLLQRLSVASGLSRAQCELRIELLAQGLDASPPDPRPYNPFAAAYEAFRREFGGR